MILKIQATVTCDLNANHPDAPNEKGFNFTDVYSFNTDVYAGDRDDMYQHIRNDLKLVAGGGYDTDTISNVNFNFINL